MALPSAEPSSLPLALRTGAGWSLDEATQRIVSDYYGRRYEVSIHALDQKRNEQWRRLREEKTNGA